MTKINFVASQTHYVEHLAPVWASLKPEFRGSFLTSTSEARQEAEKHGIPSQGLVTGAPLTVVASFTDYLRTDGAVAFMEHGVGHTYGNDHPSYAGSTGKHRVELFLCPNEFTANRNRKTYPDSVVKVVGVPKLDKLKIRPPEGRVVTISFHWDAQIAPEARTALPVFRRVLSQLPKDERFSIIGHCHPRPGWPEKMKKVYANANIPFVQSFADILDRADLYVVDVSSTAYEFAAAGRPVIHLNAPWYRRNINHGLRFWEHLPGPMVDTAYRLADTINNTLNNPQQYEQQRLNAVRYVTPHIGEASRLAAEALEAHVS